MKHEDFIAVDSLKRQGGRDPLQPVRLERVSLPGEPCEHLISQLTRQVTNQPSSQLFRHLAACYQQLDEHEEASILLDLASRPAMLSMMSPAH
ncbi:MAG TPA: hypothetical protein PKC67_04810 [Kiritimatiellia bacterium]|nr:hypothetical protein [Kiritimatiellia bacterium]HMP33652.1 hypothetical protein [Kiritimatiellia bacterium]